MFFDAIYTFSDSLDYLFSPFMQANKSQIK